MSDNNSEDFYGFWLAVIGIGVGGYCLITFLVALVTALIVWLTKLFVVLGLGASLLTTALVGFAKFIVVGSVIAGFIAVVGYLTFKYVKLIRRVSEIREQFDVLTDELKDYLGVEFLKLRPKVFEHFGPIWERLDRLEKILMPATPVPEEVKEPKAPSEDDDDYDDDDQEEVSAEENEEVSPTPPTSNPF